MDIKTKKSHFEEQFKRLDELSKKIDSHIDFATKANLDAIKQNLAEFSDIRLLYKKFLSVENKLSRLSKSKFGSDINNSYARFLAPNIHTHVHFTQSIDYIPNTPIYWVKNLNQFAIKINNVVFRGNIGNILECKSVYHNVPCKYGKDCVDFRNNKCRFFHDPIEDDYGKLLIRNFVQNNFLYSEKRSNKTKHMIHFGSRDNLCLELTLLKQYIRNKKFQDEPKRFLDQTMHNILVCLALKEFGIV